MANITVPEPDGTVERAGIEQSANETRITNTNAPVDTSGLFEEQQRAFEIINWHIAESLACRNPPQLLMHVLGAGGVGKSKVIETITDNFEKRGIRNQLVKAAYTGIAASIIGGSTLHTVARLPHKGSKQSAESQRKLANFWANICYLIIDEISMVGRDLLAKLSRILATAKAHAGTGATSEPFGGVNVIIFGDLHQFPPVAGRKSAPLFWPINQAKDTEDEMTGREIYERFQTVVKLCRQVRVTDPEWQELLQHARMGNCQIKHLKLLHALTLTNPNCPDVDMSKAPWNEAVLVTPRHAVRNQWNEVAVLEHCSKTGSQLFISPAEDTISGRELTLEEKYVVATKRSGRDGDGHSDKGGLAPVLMLAIGMKVMVTSNIETELDIANGARGKVVDIMLDKREPAHSEKDCRVKLQYPPVYVLVKLNRTKARVLEELEAGVVPIAAMKRTLMILDGQTRKTVSRRQIPLTAAYAFTDYRSQGQTLPAVIVDIATPPTGGLTPFNAYVQLSRSSGSSTIRILRDFEDKLFTSHPCEFLRKEDERLEELDAETKRWWEAHKASIERNEVN